MQSHNKDFFVGIYDPIDVRRNTLECSKSIINSLQAFDNLEQIRERKVLVYKEMLSLMAELDLIMSKLEKRFPKAHLRKVDKQKTVTKETKTLTTTEFTSELQKLGRELKDVETELMSINKVHKY